MYRRIIIFPIVPSEEQIEHKRPFPCVTGRTHISLSLREIKNLYSRFPPDPISFQGIQVKNFIILTSKELELNDTFHKEITIPTKRVLITMHILQYSYNAHRFSSTNAYSY